MKTPFFPFPVLPVTVIRSMEDAPSILSDLLKGGIPTAEITFRTSCAAQAISLARTDFPSMFVGAGTVLNEAQAREALAAGAQFLVSPGLDADVAKLCEKNDVPYLPGCVTPTEIMQALSLGIDTVKFFPANVYGGLSAIKALSAPFGGVRFVPTGGVTLDNLKAFLDCPSVAAVGGSYMFKGDLVENCRKTVQLIKHTEEV